MLGICQSHIISCHRSSERIARGIKPAPRLRSNKYLLPFLFAHCGNRCKKKFSDLWEVRQKSALLLLQMSRVKGTAPIYLLSGAKYVGPSRTDLRYCTLLLTSDIPTPFHTYRFPLSHMLSSPPCWEQQIPLCQARQYTDKWPSETLRSIPLTCQVLQRHSSCCYFVRKPKF